jgi:hypothetical protein
VYITILLLPQLLMPLHHRSAAEGTATAGASSTSTASPCIARASTGANSWRQYSNTTTAATVARTTNTTTANSSSGAYGSGGAHYSSAAAACTDTYIALLTEQLDDDENHSKRQKLNGFQVQPFPTDDPFAPAQPGSIMNDVEQTTQHAILDGLTQQLWHTCKDTSAADAAAAAVAAAVAAAASAASATTPAAIAT